MERSMVQQLKGLSSSQFINNRSTFISTSVNQGDYELRKSRIQNLPSYRKEDMSSRVNFVVVFQTIEIQRLSNQVQALRIALKDAQRQNFNVRNYQVQIRELTQKCFAYERERQQYRDQIDKLNMICEKLYEELQNMKNRFADIDPTIKQKFRLEKQRTQKLEQDIEKWRARYSALETSKSRQMQDMKLMMESQRKSMIDREIKQLSLRFNSERQNLQKQIRKLRQALDGKDVELQRVNGRVSQLQILNQELRRYQRTIDEYENKFAMISQETVRLNDLLRHKQQDLQKTNGEIGNYRRKISQFQRKLKQLQDGGEKARALQDQLREWKTKYSRIQQQNRQYKQQLNKIPEFKQIIQQINTQSDRLKDVVRQKIGQIDDWKGKYQRIDSQFRDNKAQQQQKLPVLQNKLNQLNNQNDRLNSALKTRAGQIQNWKNKFSQTQRRFTNLEQDRKNLQNQMNNQVRQINQLQVNIRQLEPQAKKLGEIQKQLSNERNQKQQCKRQIDRLNNAVRGASQKIDNYQKKCVSLQRDLKNFSQIQEQLRIYKQKEINLTKQIDRINGIISQKIKEIQALKQVFQRFQKSLSQYQGIQKKLMDSVNQTQKLIHDLDESRKQIGFIQDKLVSSQSQGRKLKNDVFALSQEKEQIVRLVNTRTQQLEQSKLQCSQLQGQISQLRQKQARLREIQEKLRITENNLNEVDRKLKSQTNRSKQLNQNLEQASAQLSKIKKQGMMSPKFKQQFFQLRSQSQQRQREFRSLQQRIITIQGIIKKLKEAIIKQDQLAKRNTDKFGAISKQIDVGAQAVKKLFDLQTQILRLNEENMQLEGKMRIMGVQNNTLKQSYSNKGAWQSQKQLLTPIEGISTRKTQSFNSQYDIPTISKTSSYSNVTTSNIRTSNALSPSNFPNTIQTLNITTKTQTSSNFGFPNIQSQGNISSTSSSNKIDSSYVNFDAFKKNNQQLSTDQYQSSEPLKFQFKSPTNNNNRPDF